MVLMRDPAATATRCPRLRGLRLEPVTPLAQEPSLDEAERRKLRDERASAVAYEGERNSDDWGKRYVGTHIRDDLKCDHRRNSGAEKPMEPIIRHIIGVQNAKKKYQKDSKKDKCTNKPEFLSKHREYEV